MLNVFQGGVPSTAHFWLAIGNIHGMTQKCYTARVRTPPKKKYCIQYICERCSWSHFWCTDAAKVRRAPQRPRSMILPLTAGVTSFKSTRVDGATPLKKNAVTQITVLNRGQLGYGLHAIVTNTWNVNRKTNHDETQWRCRHFPLLLSPQPFPASVCSTWWMLGSASLHGPRIRNWEQEKSTHVTCSLFVSITVHCRKNH